MDLRLHIIIYLFLWVVLGFSSFLFAQFPPDSIEFNAQSVPGVKDHIEKSNQSQAVWFDGSWWGAFRASSGSSVWKIYKLTLDSLNTGDWQSSTSLGMTSEDQLDVHFSEFDSSLYVLFSSQERLFRLSYTGSSWDIDDGFPKSVAVGAPTNDPGSITQAHDGDLFIFSGASGKLRVNYSADRGESWTVLSLGSASSALMDGVTFYDGFGWNVGVIVGEGDGSADYSFFRVADTLAADSPGSWIEENLPFGSYPELDSDDHVNIIRDHKHNLYAMVKVGDGGPDFFILKRDFFSGWETYEIEAASGTRPALSFDASNNILYAFATNEGIIQYFAQHADSLDDIGVNDWKPVIANGSNEFNNVSAPYQPLNSETELVVLAENDSRGQLWYNVIDISDPKLPQYSLTTSVIGSGSIELNPLPFTGMNDVAFYDSATVVMLRAVADSNYAFQGWSGDITGSSNPTTLFMGTNRSVTAVFVEIPKANIAVSPDNFNFGLALPGNAVLKTFDVTNTGGQVLNITNMSIMNDNFGSFFIESGNAPFSIQPGQTHEFVVSFTPSVLDTVAAILQISSNDDDEGVLNVLLSGVGVETLPEISLREMASGASSGQNTISTDAALEAVSGNLYIASIASKSFSDVVAVNGLGLNWEKVHSQCAGRNQTGVEIWMAQGTVFASEPVTATFSGTPGNALISVSRYAGADPVQPIGNIVSGNTNGEDGSCSGGSDSDQYEFQIAASVQGAIIYGSAAMRNRSHEPENGFQEQFEQMQGSGGSAASLMVMDYTSTTIDDIPFSGSFSNSVDWAVIGLELKPGNVIEPPVEYQLITSVTGNGSVEVNPPGGIYEALTNVVLTATPGPDFVFNGWTGDIDTPANPLTVSMDTTKSITANFIPAGQFYSVQTTVFGSGSILLDPEQPSGEYPENSLVTVTGVPAAGYQFNGWGGSLEGFTNPDTLFINSDKAIFAVFTESTEEQFTLTLDNTEFGNISLSPAGGIYNAGTVVTVTATANSGYQFSDWNGALSGSSNPASITMDANKTIGASFMELPPDQYTLSVSPSVGGDVTLNPPGGIYDAGTVVTVAAQAQSGYNFSSWSGDLSGQTNPTTITMDGDKQISASFQEVSGGGSGGPVVFEEIQTGTAADAAVVSNSAPISVASGELYLAAVTTKNRRDIVSVDGLGLTWSPVRLQCSGRDQTGVEVWMALGNADGVGIVTATLTHATTNAAIVVSRYSGVDTNDPIGMIISGNSNGLSGDCSGGVDGASYSFMISTETESAMVYGAIAMRNRRHTAGDDFTEHVELAGGSGGSAATIAVMDRAVASASDVAVSGSFNKDVDWAMIGFEIRSGGSGGGTVQHLLSVNTSGSGTVTLSPSGGVYDAGTVVTLQALPDNGFSFSQWSGGISGTVNPVTVTMNSTITVTADFEELPPDQYTLSVSPSVGGDVTLNPPGGVYDAGTVVTVAAQTLSGYNFSSWSGDLSGQTNPTTITMDGDKQISASFQEESGGGGSGGPVVFEEIQTGTAADAAVVSNSAPISVASGELYLAAVTTKNRRDIVSVNGLGLTWSPVRLQCSGRDQTGVEVWMALGNADGDGIITATLTHGTTNAAIVVSRYSGVDTNDPIGMIISSNSNGLSGDCSGGVDGASYSFMLSTETESAMVYGAIAMRNRRHTAGDDFTEHVELAGGSGGSTATIAVMDRAVASASDVAVSGSFNKDVDWAMIGFEIRSGGSGGGTVQHLLSVNTSGSGTVTLSPSGGVYDAGSVVSLAALPGAGFAFSGWSGDLSGSGSPASITMTSDKAVTATFTELPPDQYTLSIQTSGSGSVALNPPGGVYDAGTVVTLTPIPASGSQFDNWSGDLSGNANPASITINSDKNMTAIFSELPPEQFTINVQTSGSGTVTLTPPGGIYDAGTVVTLTAAAASGYQFSSWSGDLSGTENPSTVTVNSNKNISANFTEVSGPQYTLTMTIFGPGEVLLDPPGGTYAAGTEVTVTAQPEIGYQFSGWSGALSGFTNPATLTMSGDKSIIAVFTEAPELYFTIDVDIFGNGSVALDPPGGQYLIGTSVTLSAAPDAGWQFDNWSGGLNGTENPQSITVAQNTTVSAYFSEIPIGGGGPVVYEGTVTGGATEMESVATDGNVLAVPGDFYVAAIVTKNVSDVLSVSGMGLDWSLLKAQCSGRSMTGVEIWIGSGTPAGDDVVVATLASSPSNSIIAVSRFSGVDLANPVGALLSGNTLGIDGACSEGTDSDAYQFNLTTTTDGGYVFGAIALRNRRHTPGSGFEERLEVVQDGALGGDKATLALVDQFVESPTSISLEGTFNKTVDWAVIGMEIRPGGATTKTALSSIAGEIRGGQKPPKESQNSGKNRKSAPPEPVGRGGAAETAAGPTLLNWSPGDMAANHNQSIPESIQLSRNYPDPFNAETTIDYALPGTANVLLEVYNILGQRIKVLVNETQSPGYKTIMWNSTNDAGNEVASGIYFLQLTIGEQRLVGKMTLQK